MTATPLRADRADDVRSQLGYVATSLTQGNPADAMTPFDKSFPEYEKLSTYFRALNAYTTNNEVDVKDEEDTPDESKVTAHWTLTLTDLGSNATQQRGADLTITFAVKNGKLKIVALSPSDFFNPQQQPEKH